MSRLSINSLHHLVLLSCCLLISHRSIAMEFFDQRIDFWKKEQKKTDSKSIDEPSKVNAHNADKPFNWNKQLDPNNDEFFKEGDHTPPKPLMELARDPSDENIAMWFKWIEKRNALMSKMQERIQGYLLKKGSSIDPGTNQILQAKSEEISPMNLDHKRFRFRLYFESSCPHCKNMMTTMKQLKSLGYYVEIKQIDDRNPQYPVPFPVLKASPGELQEKRINAWPVLFVADTTKHQVVRINGYQDTTQVLSVLQQM